MIINIFQGNLECYFWTQSEISKIKEENPGVIVADKPHPYTFTLHSHTINLIPAKGYEIVSKGLEEKELGDMNVFLNYGALQPDNIKILFNHCDRFPNKRFVVLSKHPEDYWISLQNMQDDSFMRSLAKYHNLKCLWDVDIEGYTNFIFHPKMLFHNYTNNQAFQGGSIFPHTPKIFALFPKKYRVGYHVNKVTNDLRLHLVHFFSKLKSPHLFFTTTKEHKSNVFDVEILPSHHAGITNDWYIRQFFEQTIWSSMEVIYETSTCGVPFPYLHKWTEKTIKHLLIGKPFIHSDPIAHSLMKIYGLETYDSLYTPQLLSFFNKFTHLECINLHMKENIKIDMDLWFYLLDKNIEWLLEMSDEEFSWRISQANNIAEKNRLHIDNLLYNTSLLPIITDENIWKS